QGVITTVAGNGTTDCTGDGGPATLAGIPYPIAMEGIGTKLLVAETCGHIRSVNLQTNIITTFAGIEPGGFDGGGHTPLNSKFRNTVNLSGDRNGVVLVADSGNNRIRRIGATVQTIAGGFTGDGHLGTQASLNFQAGIAFDSQSNLYIADSSNSRVRKVSTAGI